MTEQGKGKRLWQLEWQEERRTLTLGGEPVLEYILTWPEIAGGGLGGRWITRYYRRLARAWRLRWQQEVYWKACLDLANRRAASRPFVPWTGRLSAEAVLQEGDLLSLRLEGEETHGNGKPCRARWGDAWSVRTGAPLPFRELFPGKTGRRRQVTAELLRQGEARRTAGALFLDPGWEKKLARNLSLRDFCLTKEGIELAFPQCLFSPAAEGAPVFILPLSTAQTGL